MSELAFAPLARFADVVMGQSPGADLCNTEERGLPFLQGCAEFGPRHPHSEVYCSPPLRVAKTESVLISVRAPVGTMNYADQDYCIGRGLGAFKAKSGVSNTVFLKHAVELNAAYLHRRSQGSTFAAVSTDDVKTVPIPVFMPEKQEKIATILTRIDTVIEQTEALIEKYQHIKAGLMHDLFTRGVLPNGQLRLPRELAPELYQETAIGWIPREWVVRKLGLMAKIVSGVTLGSKGSTSGGLEVPYLRVANVQDGYLDLTVIKTVRITRKELEQLRLHAGDVLMNEGGDFDKLGRGSVWSGEIEDCVHQNHVFRVRTDSTNLLPYFLAFYSESSFGKKYFLINSKQSTNLASINSTQLNTYPITLPSLQEQKAIIERINATNARIEKMRVEAGKLRNKKSGLMQDLLTGKVPVKAEAEAPEAVGA